MLHFKQRHPGPELMDDPNVNHEDLVHNLIELETINTLLGGYNTTFKGLAQLMTDKSKTYRILDIGCGGGDTISATHAWAQKNGYKISFTGLDISATAIAQSQKRCAHIEEIDFLEMSFQKLSSHERHFDIAMCSLFTHHLDDQNLIELLRIMKKKAILGFVINDLHRSKIAWLSISILTQFLSKSHLVKHDAPLSVKRGFIASEWKSILHRSGLVNYTVRWSWAFRHCIVFKHA